MALAGGHKSHGRPGIEASKELLRVLQTRPGGDPYTQGLIDALRYVTGEHPIAFITAQLTGGPPS